jgi:predicted house-cleaning noncanonical NTP pyrophosphatase (MazG superfamily)
LPADAWTYGIAASLALHAFLAVLIIFVASPRPPAPPVRESVPVEIWTPEQVQNLVAPARPDPGIRASSDNAEPPLPASAVPDRPGTFQAARILSSESLAHPLSRKMREVLPLLEEDTRLEQLCDLEAMAQIAALPKGFQPDRVVAYARSETKLDGHALRADGAAFRSRRQWFGLSFTCGLTFDRQAVQSFEFTLGKAISRRFWEKYNLPDPGLDTD